MDRTDVEVYVVAFDQDKMILRGADQSRRSLWHDARLAGPSWLRTPLQDKLGGRARGQAAPCGRAAPGNHGSQDPFRRPQFSIAKSRSAEPGTAGGRLTARASPNSAASSCMKSAPRDGWPVELAAVRASTRSTAMEKAWQKGLAAKKKWLRLRRCSCGCRMRDHTLQTTGKTPHRKARGFFLLPEFQPTRRRLSGQQ